MQTFWQYKWTRVRALRYRIPKVVIARMGINILLNAVIGLIPGIGEAFAFWFRPSHRNYELIRTHLPAMASQSAASRRKDWFFVTSVVIAVFLLVLFCGVVGAYVLFPLLKAIFGN